VKTAIYVLLGRAIEHRGESTSGLRVYLVSNWIATAIAAILQA